MTRSQDGTTGPLPSPREAPKHRHQGIEDRGSRREQLTAAIKLAHGACGLVDPDWVDADRVAAQVADAIMALPHTVRAEPVAPNRGEVFALLGDVYEFAAFVIRHRNVGALYSHAVTAQHKIGAIRKALALPQDPDPLIGELVGTARALLTECEAADEAGDLGDQVHGMTMFRLHEALDKARLYQGEG